MIRPVLEHISGVGVYGVVSICLFFGVFLGVLLRVARMKRTHADVMAALPLQDGEPPRQPPTDGNHD